MTDQVTIKNGAFVAMAWSAQSEEIRTLFERDPEAALAGMLEAAVGDEIRLFSLDPYSTCTRSRIWNTPAHPSPWWRASGC